MDLKQINTKVSIIIPVYNTEQYIERCIHSVLNQTYKNLEIICINDGSSDKSGEILDILKKKDSRIKVIHSEKKGVTYARNFALHIASGDYIGFVDSDDYIAEEMYELMVDALLTNHVDLVVCNYCFDYSGKIKTAENKKNVPLNPIEISDFLPYMYERDTYPGVASYLWNRLFRREVLINEEGILNIEFCEEYGGVDDIVFVAEASMRCHKVLYLEKALYYYFQRENSITHDGRKQLETLHWIKAYEKILNLYDINHISKQVMELIERMYVYRCGRTLELAFKYDDEDKVKILKNKIYRYLLTYFKTNIQYLDRIQWIVDLLMKENR